MDITTKGLIYLSATLLIILIYALIYRKAEWIGRRSPFGQTRKSDAHRLVSVFGNAAILLMPLLLIKSIEYGIYYLSFQRRFIAPNEVLKHYALFTLLMYGVFKVFWLSMLTAGARHKLVKIFVTLVAAAFTFILVEQSRSSALSLSHERGEMSQALLDRIQALARGDQRKEIEVVVVADEEDNAKTAFTDKNERGTIIYTRGMLDQSAPDEVIGVTAHELGHMDRLGEANFVRGVIFATFVSLFLVGVIIFSISQKRKSEFEERLRSLAEARVLIKSLCVAIILLISLYPAYKLGINYLQRNDEKAADIYAAALLSEQNLDASWLCHWLERQKKTEKVEPPYLFELLYFDHPRSEDRIKTLKSHWVSGEINH